MVVCAGPAIVESLNRTEAIKAATNVEVKIIWSVTALVLVEGAIHKIVLCQTITWYMSV